MVLGERRTRKEIVWEICNITPPLRLAMHRIDKNIRQNRKKEGVEPLSCYIALRLGVGSVSGVGPRLLVHHVAVRWVVIQRNRDKKRK